MTVTVRNESGTIKTELTHRADTRDYVVGVATRINQVEIRGGDNAHPLQLGEVRISGSELIREAMSGSQLLTIYKMSFISFSDLT